MWCSLGLPFAEISSQKPSLSVPTRKVDHTLLGWAGARQGGQGGTGGKWCAHKGCVSLSNRTRGVLYPTVRFAFRRNFLSSSSLSVPTKKVDHTELRFLRVQEWLLRRRQRGHQHQPQRLRRYPLQARASMGCTGRSASRAGATFCRKSSRRSRVPNSKRSRWRGGD